MNVLFTAHLLGLVAKNVLIMLTSMFKTNKRGDLKMTDPKIGLYIGRFQPFHNGHLSVVRQMSKEMDHGYIVVGSADKSEENANPFTFRDRGLMIKRVLDGKKIDNVKVAGGVEDKGSDRTWMNYVMVILGSKVMQEIDHIDFKNVYVYTRNPIVKNIFGDAGFKVKAPKPFNNGNGKNLLSATYIKECIKYDRDEWTNLVPCEVQDYIYECHGIATIKRCS
jgi:nicotinamide-nucleotide adenylyltransferase